MFITHTHGDHYFLDATVGDKEGAFRIGTHNTIPMLRLIVSAFRENKMLKENCTLIASHLARTLHGFHEETCEILKEIDMITAYDGFKTDVC